MNMKSNFKVLLVYPNLPLQLVPPLSISIFSSILKKAGYSVELFDATKYIKPSETTHPGRRSMYMQSRRYNEKLLYSDVKQDLFGDFIKIIEAFSPEVLLFSVLEDTWPQAKELLERVKDYKLPTLVGGVFTTYAPEIVIQHPCVSMICIGEGENAVLEFCERIRLGKSVDNVPNLWIKKPDNTIIRNPPGELTDINLGTIPDLSIFEESRFYRPMGGHVFKTIPLETIRGCNYRCAFCNSASNLKMARDSGLGLFTRRKNIAVLVKELRTLIEIHNPEFIYIYDDCFLARPDKELYDFCKMYEEFNLPFWCQTRVETVSAEKLEALKSVGCFRMSYGIEHGNEEFRLKMILRRCTNKNILEKFQIVAKVGIPFTLNCILGFPFETRELVFDTIKLNAKIADYYDSNSVSIFTPYHGTALRDVAIKANFFDPGKPTNSTTTTSLLEMPPPYLQVDEIDGLMRTFNFYAKFPKNRWDEIQRAETFDEEGNRIWNALSKEYEYLMWGGKEVVCKPKEKK